MILQLALAVIPAVLAITLHEAAHGYAALALGDDTARKAGRLSLNPLVHVDRVGTILLPGFLLISQLLTIGRVAFMFGWAKPVPVAAWKFANPRRGMMVVAAAGPAMNFFLAWAAAAIALLFVGNAAVATNGMLVPVFFGRDPVTAQGIALAFVGYFIVYNLVLGLFNLLPIPPLDGGRIAVGLLPEAAARVWARTERLGILVVLMVVFIMPAVLGEAGIRFDPVRDALDSVLPRAVFFVLRMAGYGAGA
jgi:Zn-dependent protease